MFDSYIKMQVWKSVAQQCPDFSPVQLRKYLFVNSSACSRWTITEQILTSWNYSPCVANFHLTIKKPQEQRITVPFLLGIVSSECPEMGREPGTNRYESDAFAITVPGTLSMISYTSTHGGTPIRHWFAEQLAAGAQHSTPSDRWLFCTLYSLEGMNYSGF